MNLESIVLRTKCSSLKLKYHYIGYLCSVLDSTWRSQFSGILQSMLISWVAGMGCTGFVMIVLLPGDLIQAASGFPRWQRICWRLTQDFVTQQQQLTRVPSTWLECVSSSLFGVVDKSWECLPRVVFYGREWGVDTLCILPFLNALFAARWEADYEGDEEIMRDGKWIHHKLHDMGEPGKLSICWFLQGQNEKWIKWFCIALNSKFIYVL